jgi:hypothetical protein
MGKPGIELDEKPRASVVDLSVPGEPVEYLVDDGSWLPEPWGIGQVALDGDLILYGAVSSTQTFMVMRHLVTGERKLVWEVPRKSPGAGTVGTALALPYAYWMVVPGDFFARFDTRDGTIKWSNQAAVCEFISGTSTGLGACAAAGGGLIVVDFDQGTAGEITAGPYQQTNGMLSQDGQHAIWIDFRDPGPNNEHGSYDHPWGGEVYYKLLDGGAEERWTTDTPESPTMKTSPWAQDGNFAWVTMAGWEDPNPATSLAWYNLGSAAVRFH